MEAYANVRRGDPRLLGVYGYVTETPGVSDQERDYMKRYGVKTIPGTSDFFAEADCSRKNKLAFEYAFQYNRSVVRLLRAER